MTALLVYLVGKRKRTICSIHLPPTDQVTEEDMILLGDFNVHNPLWGSKKMSARGRMLEKILDEFNLLCLNEKEEIYYRAFNGCKSTIDLEITKPSTSSTI